MQESRGWFGGQEEEEEAKEEEREAKLGGSQVWLCLWFSGDQGAMMTQCTEPFSGADDSAHV